MQVLSNPTQCQISTFLFFHGWLETCYMVCMHASMAPGSQARSIVFYSPERYTMQEEIVI